MKNNSRAPLRLLLILCSTHFYIGCSDDIVVESSTAHEFVSEKYNHFTNGYLFTDIDAGIEVLWKASFINGNIYKENLGYLIEDGLIIAPNHENTPVSAKLNSLPLQLIGNKLHIEFNGLLIEVIGIIHTHPNKSGVQEPTSRYDYQYGFLGIHNYIITSRIIYDAYKWRGKEMHKAIPVSKLKDIVSKNQNIAYITDPRNRK
jgi:hypothetical protein